MSVDASGGRVNGSVSIPIHINKAFTGDLYYATMSVGLTTADEAPLLYLSNSSASKTIIVDNFTFVAELSDQFGTMDTVIYGENSGGTIESATAYTPENRRVASTSAADVDCRIGDSSKTFSASKKLFEEHKYSAQLNGGGNNIIRVEHLGIAIPPGENILVCHTPPASNTNQVISTALTFYIV